MRAITLEQAGVALDGVPVLADVSLHIDFGEWVGLVGPNGAGKTTLLRAIAGLVEAEGVVAVDGCDVPRRQRRAIARQVVYVPQVPSMPEGMSVYEYVLLGRTAHLPYLAMEGRQDHAVVAEVLERLELLSVATRRLTSLSGGEQQRAVLARALAQESPVLLLDEPTSALDVGHQQQALELVESLRHERPLAIVSAMHDLTLAGQFADRLVLLSRGRLVASGPARAVLTEAALAEHWGARVRVMHHEDGGVVVIPVRRSEGAPGVEPTGAASAAGAPARGGQG